MFCLPLSLRLSPLSYISSLSLSFPICNCIAPMVITLMRFFYVLSPPPAKWPFTESVSQSGRLSAVSEIVVQVDRFQISVMQRRERERKKRRLTRMVGNRVEVGGSFQYGTIVANRSKYLTGQSTKRRPMQDSHATYY